MSPSPGAWDGVKRNLTAGLLVLIPAAATFLLIGWVVSGIDAVLDSMIVLFVNEENHPIFKFYGRGLIIFFLLTYLTGLFARNLIGVRLIAFWERVLERIPLVRSLYAIFKQIMEAFFENGARQFEAVVLIQFPGPGMWSVGFITATAIDEVRERISPEEEMVCVFCPTTPNPTTGFFIQVRRSEVVPLNMSIENGLKYLMSSGMVHARGNGRNGRNGAAPKLDAPAPKPANDQTGDR